MNRTRLAASGVVACTSTVLVYGLLRLFQRTTTAEPDPALVLFSAHAGFFWRGWIAAFAGGMLGIAAWLGGGNDGARTARLATVLVALSAAAIVLTAVFLP